MADESGAGRVKDSRQDRLKLALRENLKRRKAQARERGQYQFGGQDQGKVTEPSSCDVETSLHGEVGKRSD